MNLSEIIAAIGAYTGSDVAKHKEVARELRAASETKPVAQLLINAGAGKKTGESQEKISGLEERITALEDEKTELQQQVEAAKGKPDELRGEYERQLKGLKDKVSAAQQERDAERDGRRADRVVSQADRAAAKLAGRVDPDYLAEVVRAKLTGRIKVAETGLQFLDAEGVALDVDETEGPSALAEDVFKVVPEKFRLRPMNAGGGSNGGGAAGGHQEQAIERQVQERHRFTV